MTQPRIGLALGGGGARGLCHVHVISVLEEFGITPSIICGTSIGAMVGAGAAGGMSGRDLEAYARDAFSDSGKALARLWANRPRAGVGLFGGLSLQLDAEQVVAAFLPPDLPERIEALSVPFIAVAADFYEWSTAALAEGDLRRAIAASIAIPVVFKPVIVDGRVMIDGGTVNPLPFDLIRDRADITIAVDIVGGPKGDPSRRPRTSDVSFGATQIMLQTITREKLRHSAPDILLRPNIDVFRIFDFLKVHAILKASEPMKDDLRRQLEDRLTAFEKGRLEGARS